MKTLTAISIFLLAGLTACQPAKQDFRITFANRTNHPIAPLVNGNRLDDGKAVVDSGSTHQYVVRVEVLQFSATGPGPDMAEVTLSARDLVTGNLSREFRRTIQYDRPEYVEFNKTDFFYY